MTISPKSKDLVSLHSAMWLPFLFIGVFIISAVVHREFPLLMHFSQSWTALAINASLLGMTLLSEIINRGATDA